MGAPRDMDLPGYLRRRMDDLGISSIRALAARVGVSPETARRWTIGLTVPDEASMRKLAEHLPAPLALLRELTGRPPGELRPFVLPPEADQLDHRQRSVIVAMVHALLDAAGAAVSATPREYPRLVGRARDPGGPVEASDGADPGDEL